MSETPRKTLIKSRLAELVDLHAMPNESLAVGKRTRAFGQALLVLSAFILIAGLYSEDWGRRAVFMFAAVLHAAVGAWHFDRAHRT